MKLEWPRGGQLAGTAADARAQLARMQVRTPRQADTVPPSTPRSAA